MSWEDSFIPDNNGWQSSFAPDTTAFGPNSLQGQQLTQSGIPNNAVTRAISDMIPSSGQVTAGLNGYNAHIPYGERLEAGLGAGLASPFVPDKSTSQLYDEIRASQSAANTTNPGAYLSGNLAGIATTLPLGIETEGSNALAAQGGIRGVINATPQVATKIGNWAGNPILEEGGNILTKGANLGAQALKNAVVAAPGGALYGAGSSPEGQQLQGAERGAGMAALIGGAIPVAGATLNAGKDIAGGINDVLSQLTPEGRQKIIGKLMNEVASDPAIALSNIQNAQEIIPGSPFTTAEASQDPGLIALQRGVRNSGINPFSDIESQQNSIRNSVLGDIAGTPADLEAAIKNRASITDPLRNSIFETYNADPRLPQSQYKNFSADVRNRMADLTGADLTDKSSLSVLGDHLSDLGYDISQNASKSGKSNILTLSKQNPATGDNISFNIRLGANPLPANINSTAIDLASPDGIKQLTNKILQNEPIKPSVNPNYAIGIADRRLNSPMGNMTDVDTAMNAAKSKISNAINLDNPEYAYALRKDLANDVAQKLMAKTGGPGVDTQKYQRLAAGQVSDILESLDQQIENAAPGYKDYMAKYSDLSKPIDQMKALQNIQNKISLTSAPDVQTGYPFLSQPALTRVLRDPEVSKILTPEQMQTMRNIESDMQRSASLNQRNIRASASDTAANQGIGNTIGSMLADQALDRVPMLGSIIKSSNQKGLNGTLIQALRDPNFAARLMASRQMTPMINITPSPQSLSQIASQVGGNQ